MPADPAERAGLLQPHSDNDDESCASEEEQQRQQELSSRSIGVAGRESLETTTAVAATLLIPAMRRAKKDATAGGAVAAFEGSSESPTALLKGSLPSCKSENSRSSCRGSLEKGGLALCRICLEEDTLANLEVPCACSGTQRHAHHICIQKWVSEKGHLRCEICHQEYTVRYVVPPSPPPPPVVQPMYIIDRAGVGRTVVSNDSHVVELMDDGRDHEHYNHHPVVQWGMTFLLFLMFMLLLHPDSEYPDDGDYNWPSSPPPSPPHAYEDDGNGSLPLFLLAVFVKILFIAIPMVMVFGIAMRGVQGQRYEQMVRQSEYDTAMQREMRASIYGRGTNAV